LLRRFVFMEHGTQKLFGFAPRASGAGPEALTLVWFAAVTEVVGGALLLVGLFTRSVALVLLGEMAFAYFIRRDGELIATPRL